MALAFLLGRIIVGAYFLMNAWNHFTKLDSYSAYAAAKGVPSPKTGVFVSGVLILLGGLGVLFGVSPTASLTLLILFLVPVSFYMHAFWKEADPNARMMEQIAFLKNLALVGALLMLYAVPLPWVYSVL
jgi:putative oxidoreductase